MSRRKPTLQLGSKTARNNGQPGQRFYIFHYVGPCYVCLKGFNVSFYLPGLCVAESLHDV